MRGNLGDILKAIMEEENTKKMSGVKIEHKVIDCDSDVGRKILELLGVKESKGCDCFEDKAIKTIDELIEEEVKSNSENYKRAKRRLVDSPVLRMSTKGAGKEGVKFFEETLRESIVTYMGAKLTLRAFEEGK